MRPLPFLLTATITAALVVLPTAGADAAGACAGAIEGDLNGDGFGDLVITEYGRTQLQGGVHVLYGTAAGLTAVPTAMAPDDVLLTQDSPGVPDTAETADEWGATLAVGDFNGDRCADLAVGAPGENQAAGAVTILYGSPAGITTAGAAQLSQSSRGVRGAAEPHDRFGAALAVGDFDADGLADLAVGAPGESVKTARKMGRKTARTMALQAGTVNVFYGAAGGLNTGRTSTELRPGRGPAGGKAKSDDAFGAALAAGDLTGSGLDALIVGIPGKNGKGAVLVLPGGPDGLAANGTALTRSSAGLPGNRKAGDRFGAALSTGDFDGDSDAELAIGVPGDKNSRGGVTVVYSAGATGLTGAGAQHWTQNSPGLGGDGAAGDRFGAALAAGRLNAGARDDLAIGIAQDAVGSIPRAGAVAVLLGGKTGLSAAGSQLLHQDVPGVGGVATSGDRFGSALTIRQITGKGPANLIVGTPAEGITGTVTQRAGAFEVLGAAKAGPTGTGSRYWALETPNVEGDPAPGVFLGYAFG